MKRYLFGMSYYGHGRTETSYHEESFECDADAMVRARKILHEGKRDCDAYLISLWRFEGENMRHVVSYQ